MYLCVFLGFLQLMIIIFVVLYEYKKKSTSIFLWIMLLVIFGIMHFLECLIGSSNYSYYVLNEASGYVILFCTIYLIMRCFIGKNVNNVISFKKDIIRNEVETKYKRYYQKFYYVLFFILAFSVFYRLFLLITQSGGLLNTSWATMRKAGESTGLLNFSEVFTILYFVGSCSLFISVIEHKRMGTFIISALMMIEVIISRNRIEILPFLCAFLISFINKNKKINFKIIFFSIIILFFTIYLVYGLRVFRHYGTLNDFVSNFSLGEFNEKIGSYIQTDDGELGLKKYFYYFIEGANNFNNFGKGHTYIRMILVLIPTGLSFGLKPQDFAISMGSVVNPLISGYSVHPTLFGDCYANFGFFGLIALSIFWALFVTFFDKIVVKTKSNYLSLCFIYVLSFSYIIIGRGSVYNGFVWLVYSMIFLFILNIVCRIKLKKGAV